MATGDVIAATITNVAGYTGAVVDITIEGWAGKTAVTEAFGWTGSRPGASSPRLTITSEGYNSAGTLGTTSRTVYLTEVYRKPTPNEADDQVSDSGSDLVIRIGLSEPVFNDDVSITFDASASWIAGGVDNAAAASGFSVTNSSALDYPQAIAQWDPVAGVVNGERVKTAFTLAVNAIAPYGIACVKVTATGATSLHAETATITTQTKTQRSATSLYGWAFQASIPLTSFTQGETINCHFQAYPNVGDASSIRDTTGRTTLANECLGYNQVSVICDKSDLLDVIRYVSESGDDTADGSLSTPYRTIAKAVNEASVNVVRLLGNSSSHRIGSGLTRKATGEWVVIEPNSGVTGAAVVVGDVLTLSSASGGTALGTANLIPGETLTQAVSGATVIVVDAATVGATSIRVRTRTGTIQATQQWTGGTSGGTFTNGSGTGTAANTYRCERLKISGLTVRLALSVTTIIDGEDLDNCIWYDGCTFDDNALGQPGTGPQYRSDVAYFTNCDGDLSETDWAIDSFSTARNACVMDGVVLTGGTVFDDWYRIAACTIAGLPVKDKAATNPAPVQENWLFVWNEAINFSASAIGVEMGERTNPSRGALAGCVFEKTSGTTALLNLWSDTQSLACDGAILAHNTFLGSGGGTSGERCNMFYNDIGTASVDHANVYVRGNYFARANIKNDVFGTPSANRIGNWDQLYGCGWSDNVIDNTDTFDWEFRGVGHADATPTFVDSGNDDYAPASGDTVLRGGLLTYSLIAGDLYGNAFDPTPDIGAVQFNDPATLLTPADLSTTTDATPELTWSGGVANYTVQVNEEALGEVVWADPTYEATGIATTSHVVTDTLAPGLYYWRVVDANGTASEVWEFTVSANDTTDIRTIANWRNWRAWRG